LIRVSRWSWTALTACITGRPSLQPWSAKRPPHLRRRPKLRPPSIHRSHQQGPSRELESIPPFILRPVATSLLMVAIMLTGIIGYRQLPVSALP